MKRLRVLGIGTAILALGFWGVTSVSAYEEAAVSNGGTVSGKMTYKGDPPPAEHFLVSKNPEFCGEEVDFYHIRVNKGALLDGFALIEGIEKGKPLGSDVAEFIGKDCAFLPYTTVVPAKGRGTKGAASMHVVNQDDVIHNPHTFEMIGRVRRSLFNIGLPKAGSELTKKLKIRKGNVVKLQCDQHDFMHSWVRVVKNPYWINVGKDGSYTIADVPPGNYTLVAWHPLLGEQKQKITVEGKGSVTANFEFSGKGVGR
jgi:hypothetical protein